MDAHSLQYLHVHLQQDWVENGEQYRYEHSLENGHAHVKRHGHPLPELFVVGVPVS